MPMNQLYYGDNLEVLRDYIADESVDLVYLDPPFNSNASYNVLFAEHATGKKAAAQVHAFEDTWRWDEAAALAYKTTVESGGEVALALRAFQTIIPQSDMLAYLAMMAPRLVELHRVLKSTGSLYLHCDPAASHYLKLLLDSIFGAGNFKNEIVWRRHGSHNDAKKAYAAVHDVILYYAKSSATGFNPQYTAHDPEYVAKAYRNVEADGRRFQIQNLASPSPRPNLTYPYTALNGITYQPHPNGWKFTPERMLELDQQGRLYYPKKADGRLRLKNYLDEMKGPPISDVWTDVGALSGSHAERLGYPTQKPVALLERIIEASSDKGDVVLDPFCGCGTTIAAAQALDRQWIGIDITHLAIGLIKKRLRDTFGQTIDQTYEVKGEPTDLAGAQQLADEDKFQFQAWVLGLVGARQAAGKAAKRGADKGVDGRLFFHDGADSDDTKQIVISVKGGKLKPDDVRALDAVRSREGAEIGVLLSMQAPTKGMRADAASAGHYDSSWGQHARVQLLTVEDLLDGKTISYPAANLTMKTAPKAEKEQGEQLSIGD